MGEEAEYREIYKEELEQILEDHKKWLESNGKEGKRADLIKVNLQKARLWKANLKDVYLKGANLQKANLSKADLKGKGSDLWN